MHTLNGIRVYIAPETTRAERARIPKRRRSRRWQKKFMKRYGFNYVSTTVPPDGEILQVPDPFGEGSYYLLMNVRTWQAVRAALPAAEPSHPFGLPPIH
jgi:hypothetical protein